MAIITDENIGTPIKMLENGGAIVESKADFNTEFVTINKLVDGSKTAKDINVETYRNFVFEIDNEDIESQIERATRLFQNKIVNRVVHSGGKSMHCRISLVDEPDNERRIQVCLEIAE